jgi:hypothetical protein
MAQVPYRANLSSSQFALTQAKAGRSVINPGADQNYDRRVDPPGEGLKNSVGIPQALYMENVLPTPDGYRSVGMQAIVDEDINPTLGSITKTIVVPVPIVGALDIVEQITIHFIGAIDILFVPELWFQRFVPDQAYSNNTTGYVSNPIYPDHISWAFVQGVLYIHIIGDASSLGGANQLLYSVEYNQGTDTLEFTDVTASITGAVLNNLLVCILGSYNYLVLVYKHEVFWSSLTNALDFTASLVSGAGQEVPTALTSQIRWAVTHPAGFIIYTANNAIGVSYTGNRAYPWRFREVPNSGGVFDIIFHASTGVAGDVNSVAQYVLSSNGQIQAVTLDNAQNILSQLSDYLTYDDTFDAWNDSINDVELIEFPFVSDVSNRKIFKISTILDRYLFISYATETTYPAPDTIMSGKPLFLYCFVWDSLLDRLGKLKIEHTDVWFVDQYIYFVNGSDPELSQFTYKVYTRMNLQEPGGEVPAIEHSGVLILGKFQYVRDRLITLEELDIESAQDTTLGWTLAGTKNLTLFVDPSYDGKNFDITQRVTPYVILDQGSLIKTLAHVTGKSFRIGFIGAFDLASIELKCQIEGHM